MDSDFAAKCAFKKLTLHLLNNMMGKISLPTILHRVVQDPAYNTGKFGEIRELIMGMFETYNYEKQLNLEKLIDFSPSIFKGVVMFIIQAVPDSDPSFGCLKCSRRQVPEASVSSPRILYRRGPVTSLSYRLRSKSAQETRLNSYQLQALDFLRKCQKASPRLIFIEDLACDNSKVAKHKRPILNKEDEALKLNSIPACCENFENEF